MATNDHAHAIGTVRVVKHDLNGSLIYDHTFKNQLTTYARSASANLWVGTSIAVPSLIAVGTGSPPDGQTGTSANDTALWSEMDGTRNTLDFAITFLQYYSQYSVDYDQTEAIGTVTDDNPTAEIAITEAGLFDANGNLWSHVKLDGVTHDNQSTLSIQWQVLHTGN